VTLAAIVGIVVGVGMIAQWGVSLATKQVPELESEPFRIGFHLAGEFATAIALIVAGLGLLARAPWGRGVYLVSAGMLLYTVIVSPGYFAQKRAWPMVGVFAVILVLTLVSIGLVA